MKIVVFGPERRVGAIAGEQVVDLNHACAKYLRERQNEPNAEAMAGALAPASLMAFIEAGPLAIESAEKATDYVLNEAGDKAGIGGARVLHALSSAKLHAPYPGPGARIACAGGNYAQHSAGMASAHGGEEVTPQQVYERARAAGM